MFFKTIKEQRQAVYEFAMNMMECINTPVSLSIFLQIKHREFDDLVKRKLNPSDYSNRQAYSDDYQAISLISKWELLETQIDKDKVAMQSFLKAELQCGRTNERFLNYQPVLADSKSAHLHYLLLKASEEIRKVLGPIVDLDDFVCRFGPGATTMCRGKDVTLGHKLSLEKPSASPALASFLRTNQPSCQSNLSFLRGLAKEFVDGPCSAHIDFTESDSNRLVFVPKNGKTSRSICIENDVNIYYQLGIGDHIRRRLRSQLDLDLNHQADKNRHLAYLGSKYGGYATIDLASASDTISFGIVSLLVPEEWLEMLTLTRVNTTKLPDGRCLRLNKFSAMGNGFTFELETLIFTCLMRACINETQSTISDKVAVSFGDDIIINTEFSAIALELLEYCGFSINTEKTYTTGSFRESCGADFFEGCNVRPYFLKKGISYAQDVFQILNSVRKLASSNTDFIVSDARFYSAWSSVLQWIPKALRFFGPRSEDSNTIWVPRSEVSTSYNRQINTKCGILKIPCLVYIAKKIKLSAFPGYAQMGAVLYSIDLRGQDALSIRQSKIEVKGMKEPVYWDFHEGCWLKS